jgi:chromate transporter
MSGSPLIALTLVFGTLSLFSVGGGVSAIVPEFHRQAVEIHGWMTSQQFADLFAIARSAPGPGLMIVPLIGYQVAGAVGAACATAAFIAPASLTTYVVASLWDRFRAAPWIPVVQLGLVPVSVGLLFASAFIIAVSANTGPLSTAVILGTALLGLSSRIPLLLPLGLGALIGIAGLL